MFCDKKSMFFPFVLLVSIFRLMWPHKQNPCLVHACIQNYSFRDLNRVEPINGCLFSAFPLRVFPRRPLWLHRTWSDFVFESQSQNALGRESGYLLSILAEELLLVNAIPSLIRQSPEFTVSRVLRQSTLSLQGPRLTRLSLDKRLKAAKFMTRMGADSSEYQDAGRGVSARL